MGAPEILCPGCFLAPWDGARCGACGYERDADAFHGVLDVGTVLQGRYRTGRVLGRPGASASRTWRWTSVLIGAWRSRSSCPASWWPGHGTGPPSAPPLPGGGGALREHPGRLPGGGTHAGRFSPPNVVRVLDYFEANGTAYFAMEFYEGTTLADRVAALGRSIAADEAMAVAGPFLEALEEVHSQGVLHRDLKPSNIYLTRDDGPVILDFGSARQTLGVDPRTLPSVLTPGYAPFEQYHGSTSASVIADLLVGQHLVDEGALHIQDLPVEGEDRLIGPVASCLAPERGDGRSGLQVAGHGDGPTCASHRISGRAQGSRLGLRRCARGGATDWWTCPPGGSPPGPRSWSATRKGTGFCQR